MATAPFLVAILSKEFALIQVQGASASLARTHPSPRLYGSTSLLFVPFKLLYVDPALTFNCKPVPLPNMLDESRLAALSQLRLKYWSEPLRLDKCERE